MIVWNRWGILQLLIAGLSVLTGFSIKLLLFGNAADSGPEAGIFVGFGFIIGGIYTWLFNKYVAERFLDKPKPLYTYTQLETPNVDEHGRTITYRPVPIINPETGQVVYSFPRSTFFFIPFKAWVYVMPAIGLLIVVMTTIQMLIG